ncbi:MAG: glycine betaine ABC transporter substrate-binding protein [Fidelibacterota bacterium]
MRLRWGFTLLIWGAFHGFVQSSDRSIVVGSKPFTENYVLAELLSQIIEAKTPYTVERKFGLEGTYGTFRALREGEIDVYPEYSGTGALVILKSQEVDTDNLKELREIFESRFGITWLEPFGFNNSWALIIPERVAVHLGIGNYTQLRGHGDLRAAFTHEFLEREDGWRGLKEAYGLNFRDVRGIRHHLAYDAMEAGKVDLTDAYLTDGEILQYDLRVLEDDRNFFPDYFGAPLVRMEALRQFMGLRQALNSLAGELTNPVMQHLNLRAKEAGGDYPSVVADFLRERGIKGTAGRGGIMAIGRHTTRHLFLTGLAVLGAILFGIPGGIWMSRNRRVATFLMGFANAVQTIPSIALLGALIPLLGIGFKPAIVALFLYSVLPILRNTYAGIVNVPRALVEVADGQGLTPYQKLIFLELPQGARVIVAGIRTSTVICVGTATLAAFIGAGGLGEPILTGISMNDTGLILSGAVPAALLAMFLDVVLMMVENRVNPEKVSRG